MKNKFEEKVTDKGKLKRKCQLQKIKNKINSKVKLMGELKRKKERQK